ncbi:nitroreductase family deazaflavin-dependent oxidoreductase [[Mycobacterium] burgundiense]|uniref:Nitroreductase family deazaflavin-dependent oxidoreductase n=1 Tax=[Mycobacterium] burgundiense TaxID=3064286 RepID=A0ABM9LRB2_9MYCO|nr:nitroreductase family deazaflavin-dependent oxidoreductase [Mycolicibacterium sp. MU0053]CAJ1503375.1 nitroreductase family deazaflavin-dependent oxidoreductase [Mycolicibacterium sp. MU0053]
MKAADHPNHTPEVPMVFPPWVERLQIKYINPVIGPLARRVPGFAIVKHRGRTSGTPYETVVTAYRKDNVLAVTLGHGKTNWAKNVLAAGEADVQLFREQLHIVNPRIVPVGTDDESLPRIARIALKKVGVFAAEIG